MSPQLMLLPATRSALAAEVVRLGELMARHAAAAAAAAADSGTLPELVR